MYYLTFLTYRSPNTTSPKVLKSMYKTAIHTKKMYVLDQNIEFKYSDILY